MANATQNGPSEGVITENDCLSKILIPGMIIWRPVIFLHDEIKLAPTRFIEGTQESSYIAKARLVPGENIYEPEALSYYDDASSVMVENPGMVLIVKSIPNLNWTHLVVSGVSKALNAPGWSNKGGVVFCRIPEPYDLADYFMFRSEMAREVDKLNRRNANWNDKLAAVENIWPEETRPDIARLVMSTTRISDGVRTCEYCHIWDNDA